jgi:hypothetical protein
MDAIPRKDGAGEGTQATRLNEAVAELDAQLSRVTARAPFVETLKPGRTASTPSAPTSTASWKISSPGARSSRR